MADFFNGWPEDGEPMTDLIERLRDGLTLYSLNNEAADALEAKDKRIAELESALREICELYYPAEIQRIAKQALKGDNDD